MGQITGFMLAGLRTSQPASGGTDVPFRDSQHMKEET